MVTSSGTRPSTPGSDDVILDDWRQAGPLLPSVVRAGRLLILESRPLSARLGAVTRHDLDAVDVGLEDALGLE